MARGHDRSRKSSALILVRFSTPACEPSLIASQHGDDGNDGQIMARDNSDPARLAKLAMLCVRVAALKGQSLVNHAAVSYFFESVFPDRSK